MVARGDTSSLGLPSWTSFGAASRLPGLLEGAVLRSPHAHAKIVSIDTSPAFEVDGVKAVITAQDFPVATREGDRPARARQDVEPLGEGLKARTGGVEEEVLALSRAVPACETRQQEFEGESLGGARGALHVRRAEVRASFCLHGQDTHRATGERERHLPCEPATG